MRTQLMTLGLLGGGAYAARYLYRRANRYELPGAVALVTGASRGLGLALARDLAREGCRLVMVARDPDTLRRAEAEVRGIGADVLAIPCDVRDETQVGQVVDAALARFGRIDILINNAGVITMGPLETLDRADFRESMDTMFWGTYNTTMAVLPHMRQRREGRIVNISSIGGKIAAPHLAAYTAAKFAVTGFSEALTPEVAGEGIKVLTVVPGFMRTGSFLNAKFKGKPGQEYTVFTLMGNLPISSTSASRAARRIINAMQLGETELILTPQTQLLAKAHGIAPGLMVEALALAGRAMPRPGKEPVREAKPGKDNETALTSSFLTSLGRDAAREYNQVAPAGGGAANGSGDGRAG